MESQPTNPVSLVLECCDHYRVMPLPDGGIHIEVLVPPRFAALWAIKLSELRATADEIREYENQPLNGGEEPG